MCFAERANRVRFARSIALCDHAITWPSLSGNASGRGDAARMRDERKVKENLYWVYFACFSFASKSATSDCQCRSAAAAS